MLLCIMKPLKARQINNANRMILQIVDDNNLENYDDFHNDGDGDLLKGSGCNLFDLTA